MAEGFEGFFGVVEVELGYFYDMIEIQHGKVLVVPVAIAPHVPHEEGPDGFGKLRYELFEVEDEAVVECCAGADLSQGRGVALQVLYGVGVGVENLGRAYQHSGGRCGSLHEVVVVGIDAGYHVVAEAFAEFVGENGFLPFLQGSA